MRFNGKHLNLAILSAAFILQSCGNVDIVKRRYRPGFHVEMSKNRQDRKQTDETAATDRAQLSKADKLDQKPSAEPISAEKSIWPDVEMTASVVSDQTSGAIIKADKLEKVSDFLFVPFTELKQEKLNSELRRAVFNNQEDEKHGWSVISFISTGLGAVGLGLVIAGLILLVSFIFAGGFFYWWIFALAGLVFGIAGMVTGILGMRQTGRGEKRGRGFALAGMISGIVSLALGLVGLLWGLLYSVIQRLGE